MTADDRPAPPADKPAAPPAPAAGEEGPRLNDAGQARVADRLARQAEALRANLRRRKDQQRARDSSDGE